MMSMIAGDAEDSEASAEDDDLEPISKVARKQNLTDEGNDGGKNQNSSTNSKPKSNKKLTQTSEMWNSLHTIIASGGGKISQPIIKLDDTISRLQRSLITNQNAATNPSTSASLASSTFIIKDESLINPPLPSNTQRLFSEQQNGGLPPGSQLHYGTNAIVLQSNSQPAPPYQGSSDIPINSLLPQRSFTTGEANSKQNARLPPMFITSTSTPTTGEALQSQPPFGNNMSKLKDYLGTLNPVQSACLASSNSNCNLTGIGGVLPIRNLYQLQPYSKSSGNPMSFSTSTSCPATVVAASMPLNKRDPMTPSHLTATSTQNVNLLHSLVGSEQPGQMKTVFCGGQTLPMQHISTATSAISTNRIHNGRLDWARNNEMILTSKDKRKIKTSVTILDRQKDGTPWQPPLKLPIGNAWGWQVNGFVIMSESAIYINLHGPRNMARSFMLPFRNILATTKKSQIAINAKQDIWPPCNDMLGLCEDVSRWELHMCINPNTDIKATITDPWKKTYLLTIPGKLLA